MFAVALAVTLIGQAGADGTLVSNAKQVNSNPNTIQLSRPVFDVTFNKTVHSGKVRLARTTDEVMAAQDKVVCKLTTPAGGLFRKKVCRPKYFWDQMALTGSTMLMDVQQRSDQFQVP